jgi:asparagine synthase (glutamine-hydrolysing)
VQKAQYADLKVYLANDVLVKVDRMSMAHGLEVRCPLLDRRLVELAFRIPVRTKMPRLETKALLKRIAARRLPADILTRPKHGFSAPVSEWIAGPYAETFRAEVLASGAHTAAWLDGQRVRRLFEEHRTGQRDHGYALWAIWMLERWARQHKQQPAEISARAAAGRA